MSAAECQGRAIQPTFEQIIQQIGQVVDEQHAVGGVEQ